MEGLVVYFGPAYCVETVMKDDLWIFVCYWCFFFSSRRRHTRYWRDWSSDVCSSDLWCVRGTREDPHRPRVQSAHVVVQADAERLRELARPRAELLHAAHAAPCAHVVHAGDRLERAHEHRRADALGLADRVEQRVDAIGAVHVRAPGRPEQHVRARSEAGVRVARRLAVVVGLRL